jgi:adenosine deaminase
MIQQFARITCMSCALLLVGCVRPGSWPFDRDDDSDDGVVFGTGSPTHSFEDRTRDASLDRQLRSLRDDTSRLYELLRALPKGGDLHNHTSGAITTEKLIAWGAEDGACVDKSNFSASNPCAAMTTPLSEAKPGTELFEEVLAAWSMESFEGSLLEAHQHFFDAFAKYGAIQTNARSDDALADVLSKAGRNGLIYVELLQGFGSGAGASIANELFGEHDDAWDEPTLLERREQIIANAKFQPAIEAQVTSIASTLSGARQLLGCDTPAPDAGCDVEPRFIVSANRTGNRLAVFGQWVFAYELAQRVSEVVGVNLVSPEENANSLAYYDDEMFALGVLDDFNDAAEDRKTVHVSLHAGELIPAVLPEDESEHLTFHIRRAVEIAHAERIGHGVDVLGETDGDGADDLLRDMARQDVMVEICLTSNRVLLGAAGEEHPLHAYRKHAVPVALATDDQGIFRTSISDEFVAAVQDQKLDYTSLRQLVRTSLEHAFVEGESLWQTRDAFSRTVSACRSTRLGADNRSDACEQYLAENKRAALQWKLERQLRAFEADLLTR